MLAMDGANPKPEVFFPGEAGKESAEFSGDRQYVSYVSALTGQREIYIRPYQRPGQRITASVDGGREPVWARNGEVFYRSLTGEKMFAGVREDGTGADRRQHQCRSFRGVTSSRRRGLPARNTTSRLTVSVS